MGNECFGKSYDPDLPRCKSCFVINSCRRNMIQSMEKEKEPVLKIMWVCTKCGNREDYRYKDLLRYGINKRCKRGCWFMELKKVSGAHY